MHKSYLAGVDKGCSSLLFSSLYRSINSMVSYWRSGVNLEDTTKGVCTIMCVTVRFMLI